MIDSVTKAVWKRVQDAKKALWEEFLRALKETGGHEGDDLVELMHWHHCCKRDCWHYTTKEPSK